MGNIGMAQLKSGKKSSFLKLLAGNLTALTFGLLVALVLGEILTRILMPIFPGNVKLDKNGVELDISTVEPNSVYRQYTEEFDAITTITKKGYRIPEVNENPDVVFIGDSFTFGQGLKDEDTFIMQYCKKVELSCMNLGVPGFGTIEEVDRLEKYLTKYEIRPKKVYLFMFVMTSFLGAGNDLNDNLLVLEKREAKENSDQSSDESKSTLREIADTTFRNSNLARVIKFYFLPAIKNAVVIKPNESRLENALKQAQKQLIRLHELSKKYQFEYQTILLHPVQDISRGSHQNTTKHLQKISPTPVISSAKYLEPNPTQYYYSMDGHLNLKGSQKIVELLLSLKGVVDE